MNRRIVILYNNYVNLKFGLDITPGLKRSMDPAKFTPILSYLLIYDDIEHYGEAHSV